MRKDKQQIVNRKKKLKKQYPSLVCLSTDRKGHVSSEKTMRHGVIYMQKCNLEPIIKHQIKSN